MPSVSALTTPIATYLMIFIHKRGRKKQGTKVLHEVFLNNFNTLLWSCSLLSLCAHTAHVLPSKLKKKRSDISSECSEPPPPYSIIMFSGKTFPLLFSHSWSIVTVP